MNNKHGGVNPPRYRYRKNLSILSQFVKFKREELRGKIAFLTTQQAQDLTDLDIKNLIAYYAQLNLLDDMIELNPNWQKFKD